MSAFAVEPLRVYRYEDGEPVRTDWVFFLGSNADKIVELSTGIKETTGSRIFVSKFNRFTEYVDGQFIDDGTDLWQVTTGGQYTSFNQVPKEKVVELKCYVNEHTEDKTYAYQDIIMFEEELYYCLEETTGTFDRDAWEIVGSGIALDGIHYERDGKYVQRESTVMVRSFAGDVIDVVKPALIGKGNATETPVLKSIVLNAGGTLGMGARNSGNRVTVGAGGMGMNALKMFKGLPLVGPSNPVSGVLADMPSDAMDEVVDMAESVTQTHMSSMTFSVAQANNLGSEVIAANLAQYDLKATDIVNDSSTPGYGLEDMMSVISHATSEGYQIPYMTWVHGEADTGVTEKATYLNYMDVMSAKLWTAYGSNFPIFYDHCSSKLTPDAGTSTFGNTALALMDEDNFYCVGPKYWLTRNWAVDAGEDTASSDGMVHLTHDGYIIQGEWFAKAINQYMVSGDFKPLHLEKITAVMMDDGVTPDKQKVRLEFHVPHDGNLVLDKDNIPLQDGYGVSIDHLTTFDSSELGAIETVTIDPDNPKALIVKTFHAFIDGHHTISLGKTTEAETDLHNAVISSTNIRSHLAWPSKFVKGHFMYDFCMPSSMTLDGVGLDPQTSNLYHAHEDWEFVSWDGTMWKEDGIQFMSGWTKLKVVFDLDNLNEGTQLIFTVSSSAGDFTHEFNDSGEAEITIETPAADSEDAVTISFGPPEGGRFTGTVKTVTILKVE